MHISMAKSFTRATAALFALLLAAPAAQAGFLGYLITGQFLLDKTPDLILNPTLTSSMVTKLVIDPGEEFPFWTFGNPNCTLAPCGFFGPGFDFADTTIVIKHDTAWDDPNIGGQVLHPLGHVPAVFNGYWFTDASVGSVIPDIFRVTVLSDDTVGRIITALNPNGSIITSVPGSQFFLNDPCPAANDPSCRITWDSNSIWINFQGLLFADANGDPLTTIPTIVLQVEFIPEPATLALLGAGLAGLGLVRRRRSPAD